MARTKLQQDGQSESVVVASADGQDTTAETPKVRRARKRGDGEGSIYQRADGRWVASVMAGRKANGKPDRRVVYGNTRSEAQKKLDDVRRQVQDGTLGDPERTKDTVTGFLARWLEATRGNVRASTWRRYHELVTLHVIPSVGRTRLAALRPDALQRLYAAKLAEGLAPSTVQRIHRVVHTALTQAVRWGYAPRNVAGAVDPPSVPRREIEALTPESVARLIDTAITEGDRLQALWTVAVYSGLREGELLGLQWADVDWTASTIAIRRTLVRGAVGAGIGAPTFAEPKTARSRRTVPLPAEAMAALKAHRLRQHEDRLAHGPDYADYGLIFATHLGTAIGARNLIRAFKRLLARAGLPASVRVHDLRHTAASLLLAFGIDVPTTAAILGHAQSSTTLNIYAHALPSRMAAAADRLAQVIRPQEATA